MRWAYKSTLLNIILFQSVYQSALIASRSDLWQPAVYAPISISLSIGEYPETCTNGAKELETNNKKMLFHEHVYSV